MTEDNAFAKECARLGGPKVASHLQPTSAKCARASAVLDQLEKE